MAVEYPDPKPPVAVCDGCDERGAYVESEEGDGGGFRFELGQVIQAFDWRVPEGWVQFVASRPIDNPAYQLALDEGRGELQITYDAGHAELNNQRAELSAEQVAEVEQYLNGLIAEIESFEPDEPRVIMQQLEGCLCPACAIGLQSRLGLDDWPDPAEEL